MSKTRDEKIQELAAYEAKAYELCQSYNEACGEKRYDDAATIDTDLGNTIGQFKALAQDVVFCDCRDSGDPMLAAVKKLTFTVIAAKDEKVEGTDTTIRTIITKDQQIDLEKLHKFCDGIGADKNWIHMAQQLNCQLTAKKAIDLGLNPKEINDSYAMSAIAKSISLGKNPVSNTNILKSLQQVIAAMVGEEHKALSHDVNYLKSVYSKKGKKALSVSCANHRYFYGYLMDICHRIVMDKSYSVEFKAISK